MSFAINEVFGKFKEGWREWKVRERCKLSGETRVAKPMHKVEYAVVYTANLDYRGEAKDLLAIDVVGDEEYGLA